MPNTYNVNKLIDFEILEASAERVKEKLDQVVDSANTAIRSASIKDQKMTLYKSADKTNPLAYQIQFPASHFFNTEKTDFAPSFVFDADKYAGAENPNIDGKPVLVLGIDRSTGEDSYTTEYIFIDLTTCHKNYKGDRSINIEGFDINMKISSLDDRIDVDDSGVSVDTTDLMKRDTEAVAGHIGWFDDLGNVVDSGYIMADEEEVSDLAVEIFGSPREFLPKIHKNQTINTTATVKMTNYTVQADNMKLGKTSVSF